MSTSAAGARKLIFFGAPGVGKGTFASRIGPELGIPAISTGDIIRAEVKAGSDVGKEVKAFSESGKLVPDELVDKMVKRRLAEPDAQNGYILDGYPRTVAQAKALVEYETVDAVMNITLPKHVLMEKLLGRRACADCGRGYNVAAIHEGELDMPPLLPKPEDCDQCKGEPKLETRKDDTEDVVTYRLDVYEQETAPVLGFFEELGRVVNFPVQKGIADMPRMREVLGMK
ncbi:hypothetical protein FNF27_04069 [Cafeteria roenbergensis]|nr:hypothetical protein FNF31_04658 [Cafeteria roenbergensis]KAA0162790.1 hypothetical protein FNF28_04547 [Cafeteria roenbergensis]KAA0174473.1 hypothetical protein FNF27_04069 [Cafeteria roenbergensis]